MVEAGIPEQWTAHKQAWATKPVLRAIYQDLFARIDAARVPGPTLEIGGGIGAYKDGRDGVVSLDISWAPWLNLVGDAQSLPFADGSFANIVMVDVLHHLPHPMLFIAEAQRVLRPGGRLVVIEPAITPGSWPFYHFLHEERVDMKADPFGPGPQCSAEPYDANQAVPTLMFRQPQRLGLRLASLKYLSLLAYPLSGGMKRWSLVPGALVKPLLKLEDWLSPLLGRLLGFRLMAVLEKR